MPLLRKVANCPVEIQSTARLSVIACRGYMLDVASAYLADTAIQRRCFVSSPRRDFLKELLAAGTLPGLIASLGVG